MILEETSPFGPTKEPHILDLLDHPLCFAKPSRLTDITSWHGHTPFAFFLTLVFRPRIFVELGTHKGDSYCAFCQAVDYLGLDTLCYAVDTWEGDEHAGRYGPEVLEELQSYHNPLYGRFSTLIQSLFNAATPYFADHSIDLLHIDGLHTYEAVRQDFEAWLPKMSHQGIVLLHDINVRENGFGVWRLWQEIKDTYPQHLEMSQSHGLGVALVGTEATDLVREMFVPANSARIRRRLAHVGADVALLKLQSLHASRRETELNTDKVLLQQDAGRLSTELEAIRAGYEATKAEHDEARIHLQSQMQRNAALQGDIDRLSTELETLTAEHETLKAEHEATRVHLQGQEERNATLRTDIIRRNQAMVERREEIDRLSADLTTIRRELGQRVEEVRELSAALLDREADLSLMATERDRFRADSAAAQAEVQFLQNRVHDVEGEREQKDAELRTVYASTTWKAARPVRFLKDQFLRRRRTGATSVMNPVPLRDILPQADAHTFRSTGPNPQMLLVPERGAALPQGWVIITLKLDYKDIQETTPQVWLHSDIGDGFDDGSGILLRRVQGETKPTLCHLPRNLRGLRLDPCASEGTFAVPFVTIRRLTKLGLAARAVVPQLKAVAANPRLVGFKLRKLRTLLSARRGDQIKHEMLGRLSSTNGFAPSLADGAIVEAELATTVTGSNSPYLCLSDRIQAQAKARLDRVAVTPPDLIRLSEADAAIYAQTLKIPRATKPIVSIVIPVLNNLCLTLECLGSLVSNTKHIEYEAILVDDGSNSHCSKTLKEIEGLVYVRTPTERSGFGKACNLGASHARGKYLVILNNDVQVLGDWLSPLVQALEDDETLGLVGPKVIFPDGRLQEAGGLINIDGSTEMVGLFDDPTRPRYGYSRRVDYCSAVCTLIRKGAFDEIGGFDDVYSPAYYEDVDLCLKFSNIGLRVAYIADSTVVHHMSATTRNLTASFKAEQAIKNQQKFLESHSRELELLNTIKVIAFYLPQFHPLPENDRWWGKGFTEWTNVARAFPNYAGHCQPHVPTDLGFYDLRIPEVMHAQAELAKRYGVFGFCFYYYWFNGKRLLDLPIERLLSTGEPETPFCLCWANENWTRRWDGKENEVLIEQRHSDDDDRAVIRDLLRFLRHPNYIRIGGKPLLLVYRVKLFPDMHRTAEIWRKICREEGLGEIYLAAVESFEFAGSAVDPAAFGFDASVEFPPHGLGEAISPPGRVVNSEFKGVVSDYREMILRCLDREAGACRRFRSVMPRWDNTPRRQNDPYIFEYATPGAYQAWLEAVIAETRRQNSPDERIVFVNAWNEWAEGAHLEPDLRFGHGFLEATRDAVDRFRIGYGVTWSSGGFTI